MKSLKNQGLKHFLSGAITKITGRGLLLPGQSEDRARNSIYLLSKKVRHDQAKIALGRLDRRWLQKVRV